MKKSKNVDVELAVAKCLTGARLTSTELDEVCKLKVSELLASHGCDLYMAETVKLHAKKEMLRIRAQNQFTKIDGLWNDTGYPTKPFTRTDTIKESRYSRIKRHGNGDGYDGADVEYPAGGKI